MSEIVNMSKIVNRSTKSNKDKHTITMNTELPCSKINSKSGFTRSKKYILSYKIQTSLKYKKVIKPSYTNKGVIHCIK